MHPFWAVRRMTSQQLHTYTTPQVPLSFNCELRERQFCVTTIGPLKDGSLAMPTVVQVPVLPNVAPLTAGDELLSEVTSTKKPEKKREETW